jgi:integrase
MASGPYPDPRRGTWSVQYFDGHRWKRRVVVRKKPGWKPSDGMPKRPPREAVEALAHYTRIEDEARRNRPRDPGRTIRAFLETYREDYAGRQAEGSTRELDKAIRSFLEHCERAKVKTLDEADAKLCRGWIEGRSKETSRKTGRPISHKRLTQERALLAAAWSWALKRDEVDASPWPKVIVPGKPERKPRGSWTPDQFASLMGSSAPWLRDVLVLGVQTGLRVNALTSIGWKHVDLAAGVLRVPPELDKVGVGYVVPLSRTANELLLRRFATNGDDGGPILRGAKGKKIDPIVLGRAIIAACRRAGLDKPDSPCHHLRRSFGRWAVFGQLTGRPVPLYIVSRWLGHASVRTTQIYLDLDADTSAEWMTDMRGEGA